MAYDVNKNTLLQLIDLLQTTDVNKRVVVYLGAAEAIINKILLGFDNPSESSGEHKLAIMKALDFIAEKAIIDREYFHNVLIKIYNYHMDKVSPNIEHRIAEARCLYDFLGVRKYFSDSEIFAINKDFDLFKQSLVLSNRSFKFENNYFCSSDC